MRLNLSADLKLPLEWAQMATIVYGGRGAGKTTFGSVAAEEVWKQQVRFCVIDVKGDWWGLKSSADGKSAGIPVVIFGGDHQDVPLDENAGVQVADIVAALEQPVIIDLENLSKGKQIKFLAAFFERLYDVNRNPLLLLLDEIQRYAPQTIRFATPEMTMCLGAVEDLVKLGRKHGIGVIGFTQRGAGVNKEVSELCDLLMAFRTPGPLDQGRVREWLEANVTLERQKEVMSKIAELDTGTAIIASGHPQLKVFVTAAIRRRETFDSSATPKIGVRRIEPKVLSKPDLDQLQVKMAATIERAKQDDPKELRRNIAELRRQLMTRKTETLVEQHVREVQVRVEVPVLKDGQLARLEKMLERGAGIAKVIQGGLAELAPLVAKAAQPIKTPLHQPGPMPAVSRRPSVVAAPRSLAPRAAQGKEQPQSPGAISIPQQRILDSLAWLESVRVDQAKKTQLALLAEQSPTSSGYTNNLGALRSAGLIHYPASGQVSLTEVGRSMAIAPATPPTSEDLHESLFARLPSPQVRILKVLIQHFGRDPLDKVELAELAGQSPTSSGYTNNLGALRSLGLIDYPAPRLVAALPILFLEEVA